MSNKKKFIILFILVILVSFIFLFQGITPKNIDYFLPKRIKKVVAILISSYAIGHSTVIFQTITNNKILTPSVMGLDSLYLFIQTVIVFFFGSKQLIMLNNFFEYFLSIIFMVCFSALLYLTLFKSEKQNLYFLILAGMILGTLFKSLSTFMQVLLDPNEFTIVQDKMFASFNNINENLLIISIFILIFVFIISFKDMKFLDVSSLGRDIAINLGVSYKKLLFKTLVIVSILTSVSTALTGPITFLGILVVSISREVFKTYKHKVKITSSILIAVFSLILGQLLAERVFLFQTTISVIINFIGGLYFLYIILKEAKIWLV